MWPSVCNGVQEAPTYLAIDTGEYHVWATAGQKGHITNHSIPKISP